MRSEWNKFNLLANACGKGFQNGHNSNQTMLSMCLYANKILEKQSGVKQVKQEQPSYLATEKEKEFCM